MIFRSTEEEVADYFRDSEHINQSALKVLISEGPEAFLLKLAEMLRQEEDGYIEKEHFIIGSGVDTKLTFGEEVFRKRYYYSTLVNKPKGALLPITKMAFDGVLSQYPVEAISSNPEHYIKEIHTAMNTVELPGDKAGEVKVGWYMNLAKPTPQEDTTRMRKFFEGNPGEYWRDLIKAGDKQILDEGQNNKINYITDSFKTHYFTSWIFQEHTDADTVYQFPMFWKYNGVLLKGLPDLIFIDHNTKMIYIIDFKTTFRSVLKFNRDVKSRRYDFQGAFYNYGLSQNLSRLSERIGRTLGDYTIGNFAFAAQSTTTPGIPLLFPLNDDLMAIGKQGDGKFLDGWIQAVNEYKAWDGCDFNIERRLAPQKGILHLDMNFDYLIN